MAYSDKVVDHYNNPRNVGSFAKDTPGVGTGLVGRAGVRRRHEAADQGQPRDRRHRGRQVQDVRLRQRHRVVEPGHRVAEGQDRSDEAAKIKNTDIVNELKLPPVKIHCSVLAEDAIKAALADYREKHAIGGRRGARRNRRAGGATHGGRTVGELRRSR